MIAKWAQEDVETLDNLLNNNNNNNNNINTSKRKYYKNALNGLLLKAIQYKKKWRRYKRKGQFISRSFLLLKKNRRLITKVVIF